MKLTKKEKKKEYSSFPVIAEINSLTDELKDSNTNDKSVPGHSHRRHGPSSRKELRNGVQAGKRGKEPFQEREGPALQSPEFLAENSVNGSTKEKKDVTVREDVERSSM